MDDIDYVDVFDVGVRPELRHDYFEDVVAHQVLGDNFVEQLRNDFNIILHGSVLSPPKPTQESGYYDDMDELQSRMRNGFHIRGTTNRETNGPQDSYARENELVTSVTRYGLRNKLTYPVGLKGFGIGVQENVYPMAWLQGKINPNIYQENNGRLFQVSESDQVSQSTWLGSRPITLSNFSVGASPVPSPLCLIGRK